jgi:hypothetical protein
MHWYETTTGKPCYTQIAKNGKERDTTLRDAKKLGNIVPSVTSILKEANKPALQDWIANNLMMSALTLPKIETETEDEWIARVKKDSKEQSQKAAERGSYVHDCVEKGYKGEVLALEDAKWFYSVKNCLDKELNNPDLQAEVSFANYKFGGKVDLSNKNFIIDIKTTEKDLATIKTWDDHAMQLAAYQYGLNYLNAQCGIIYINVLTEESKLIILTEEEIIRGANMFYSLLDYWYAKTGLEVKHEI